jgi:uncharacterized RDD family membrane protein YckC
VTAPGWYKDPVDPAVQRYWDGDGWIGDAIPADAVAPEGPPAVEPPPPPVAQAVPAMGAVILPPGTPVPPGGFPPGQLPPGAVVLPPGVPLPPGVQPQGTLPPSGYPTGAVQVLLPPQAAAFGQQPAAMPHGRHVAGLGSRLVARLIDIAVLLLINVAVTGWLVYQYVQEMLPVFREWQATGSTSDAVQSERAGTLQVVILILIAALWFAYEVPAIANTGQTFGKRLLKIKVMRLENEDRIGYGRAIRRWNPLGLSVLLWTCGVGFVLQFLDSLSPVIDWPLHRAFHDRSAGTVVVRDEPKPTEPTGDPS